MNLMSKRTTVVAKKPKPGKQGFKGKGGRGGRSRASISMRANRRKSQKKMLNEACELKLTSIRTILQLPSTL